MGPAVLIDGRLAGVVGEGESWRAALARLADGVPAEPVDLSGDPLRFATTAAPAVSVRAMTLADLPAVTTWRDAEHVRRWFPLSVPVTTATIKDQYAPAIAGTTPTRLWTVEAHDHAIGFLQAYRLRDYPEYGLLAPDPDAVGVDFALGDPDAIGRGLGVRMLWHWLPELGQHWPGTTQFFAAPSHRNTASLRMLAKAGFTQGIWFDHPQPDGSVETVVGCTLELARIG